MGGYPVMQLPPILQAISETLHERGARAVVVGGSVRDHFLMRPSKDYDVEVYGLDELDDLAAILGRFGSVNLVGKSFGVLKFVHEGEEYDFSFPRTERKSGVGHRGFDVRVDGAMDFAAAAKRRDFTINAMGYDLRDGALLDPYGGQEDLESGVLRHVDDASFGEDPLRVYRAAQFAARFGLEVAPATAKLCQAMVEQGELDTLPRERVWMEWQKLLLGASRPSMGFELMRAWGIIDRYFPELSALIDCPQDPRWHPEGDVWTHTMMAVDAMAKLLGARYTDDKQALKFMMAILTHDLGKPAKTSIEYENGDVLNWIDINKSISHEMQTQTIHHSPFTIHSNATRLRSLGHEKAGIDPARQLLERLTSETELIEGILPLVEHHLKPSQFYQGGAKAPAIRRLATRVNLEELVTVAHADFLGRTSPEALSGEYPAGPWLLEQACKLNVDRRPLPPLIQGRDLIALGLKPSPRFKTILDAVYAKQLDGEIGNREEAMEYAKELGIEKP